MDGFNKAITVLMLACGCAFCPTPCCAEDFPSDAYYIYQQDGCVTVWCDLTPCITSKIVKQLKDGIDIAIDCRIELSTPRRLLGDRQVALVGYVPRIGYRSLTGEYVVSDFEDTSAARLNFASLAGLYDFLRDSIEYCLSPLDSLDRDERYELSLSLTVVSLSDFNTVSGDRPGAESETPLDFLFRQFLEFTQYGRTEYATRSRAFHLDELEELPQP